MMWVGFRAQKSLSENAVTAVAAVVTEDCLCQDQRLGRGINSSV